MDKNGKKFYNLSKSARNFETTFWKVNQLAGSGDLTVLALRSSKLRVWRVRSMDLLNSTFVLGASGGRGDYNILINARNLGSWVEI